MVTGNSGRSRQGKKKKADGSALAEYLLDGVMYSRASLALDKYIDDWERKNGPITVTIGDSTGRKKSRKARTRLADHFSPALTLAIDSTKMYDALKSSNYLMENMLKLLDEYEGDTPRAICPKITGHSPINSDRKKHNILNSSTVTLLAIDPNCMYDTDCRV